MLSSMQACVHHFQVAATASSVCRPLHHSPHLSCGGMPSRLQACVIAARLVPLAYLGMREARLIRNMVMVNLMGAIWICSRADLWLAASAAAVATKPIMARRPLILCNQQPQVKVFV